MRGHTLLELAAVLSLVATGTALLAPTARGFAERSAVLAARESVAGLISDARVAAFSSGQASVVLTVSPARALLLIQGAVVRTEQLQSDLGVSLGLPSGRDSAEIAFGPLGLGRFASETVVFDRGRSSTSLIVSAYGRLRRVR